MHLALGRILSDSELETFWDMPGGFAAVLEGLPAVCTASESSWTHGLRAFQCLWLIHG